MTKPRKLTAAMRRVLERMDEGDYIFAAFDGVFWASTGLKLSESKAKLIWDMTGDVLRAIEIAGNPLNSLWKITLDSAGRRALKEGD